MVQDKNATNPKLALVGALIVSIGVIITYYPSTDVGFFSEDYLFADWVVRLGLPNYLVFSLIPQPEIAWYRPFQAILFGFEYVLFGNNARGFHFVQITIHLVNCLLLYALTGNITKRWRNGLVVALLYIGLPEVQPSVFWVIVPDPLSSLFYLLAIGFWLKYLRNSKVRYYTLAVVAFLISLLSKEIGVTIPVAFFLVDRLLVDRQVKFAQLIRRYTLFALILLPYAWRYLTGTFITQEGYTGSYAGLGVGPQMFSNLWSYLATLAYPWGVGESGSFVWLLLVILVLLYLVVVKRSRLVAFVSAMAILTTLPVTPFTFVSTRYLYLPVMASAILFASILELAKNLFGHLKWFSMTTTAALVSLIFLGAALGVAEAANGFAGYARQIRAPIRPILQEHSQFPDDTYLYFLGSPIPDKVLSGMFSLRYGPRVMVSGTDSLPPAALAGHKTTYVYYFNDDNDVKEEKVGEQARVVAQPSLPVNFSIPIRLEGYEIANTQVKHGQAVIVILYWRSNARIDKDYTVFAHLIGQRGEILAGSDSQPRGGKAPTSTWKSDNLIVDWSVIPITEIVPVGRDYHLEIGVYYLPTMERAQAVDSQGEPISDKIMIGSLEIVE